MNKIIAYETEDGKLFKTHTQADKHEAKLILAKEMTKIQTSYEEPSTDCMLIAPLANGEIPWGNLLDWIGANRDGVQTILNYLDGMRS